MSPRAWALARAVALTLAAALVAPVNPLVLLSVPTALMLLAFRRESTPALAGAAVLLLAAFRGIGGDPDPLWLAVRGWAMALGGAFVAVTVARRAWGVTERSLAAVLAASAATAAAGWLRPGLLEELDWWVRRDLSGAAVAARQWLPEGLWGAGDGSVLLQARGWQEALYPALLGLASVAALGVGSYVLRRLVGREPALGPFREYRFGPGVAWLLAAGLALIVAPIGGAAARLGENAVFLAGGLYLLRGMAVLYWVGTEATPSGWSAAACVAAGLLLYPIVLPVALVLGVGDTWADVRAGLLAAVGGARRGRR